MSRAPYSTKKPKKPEYEEPPTVGITDVPAETPPQTRTIPTATEGGIPQTDKELSIAQLGEEHTFTHLLATRRSLKPDTPTIHGRRAPKMVENTPIISEPTTTKVTDEKTVTIGRWGNIPLTTPIDTVVDNRPRATSFKLEPKDKKRDVEYSEEA